MTRLGFGSAPIGGLFEPVDAPQAYRVVERAYALGLRLFDTAPLYGHGLAEQRLGRVLTRYPREDFVLSTKVGRLLRADVPLDASRFYQGRPFYAGVPPVNPVFDFSQDGIRTSLEESLQRLGLQRVDLVYIHDPDNHPEQALREAYPTLERMRSEGLIRAIGVGMNRVELLSRFARETDVDCFLVAGRYTLLDQSALTELLPLCLERGIAVVAGGVYNSGILANPRPGATFDYIPADQAWLDKACRLEAICEAHGVPLKAAALQFPLGHPAVATVLTGARSVEELEENEHLFRWPVPSELWGELQAAGLLPAHAPVPGITSQRDRENDPRHADQPRASAEAAR